MKKTIISLLSASFLSLSLFTFARAETLTDTLDSNNVSSCVHLTVGMSFGSKDSTTGGQVSDLQFFLSDKGYLRTDPTGYFGAATVAAVKEFQGANGITPNGVVGPITRAKISAVSCSQDEPVTLNPTDPLPPSVPTIGNLSVHLSFGGRSQSGAAVIVDDTTGSQIIDPLYARTWSWTTTGSASVSARYVISGENCGISGGGSLVEENWQPWLGANVTGTRFAGTNTRMLNSSYYGCTVLATYKARNTQNQVVSSTVKVVFASSGNVTNPPLEPLYYCNGVVSHVPCSPAPTISGVSPSSGPVGTSVTLTGVGFSATGNSVLSDSGYLVASNLSAPTGGKLTFTVPQNVSCPSSSTTGISSCQAFTAVTPGTYSIKVVNSLGSSNLKQFTVTQGTTTGNVSITSLSPNSGSVGSTVTINGSGFTANGTKVKMNQLPVGTTNSSILNPPVQFVSSSMLIVKIPERLNGEASGCGAPYPCDPISMLVTPGTYQVTVQSVSGVVSNARPLVITASNQPPVSISSLSVSSASVLSQVGIYGTGFTSTGNKVYLKKVGGSSMLVGTYTANMAIESNSQYLSFSVPSVWTPVEYVCNGSCQQQVLVPGNYQVYVVNTNGTSSPVALTITAQGAQSFVAAVPVSSFSDCNVAGSNMIGSYGSDGKQYCYRGSMGCPSGWVESRLSSTDSEVKCNKPTTAGSCPSNATASVINGTTQCSCAAGNTYHGGSCVAVNSPTVPQCPGYYIRNTSGVCVMSMHCASWSGTQCNQTGNTTSCPLGYMVTGTGASAYCVVDTSVAISETGTPSGSNINIPNKPGLVCANSPTSFGSSVTANVYTRDNSGNLTLTETCKGNEGKIAGVSQRGIQCQTNAQGVGAACSSQGSVFINGQSVRWVGNTSGDCYSDSACDNGYSCNTNKKCAPMVQVSYPPYLSQSDLASLPADATSTMYKRTWAGSAWGAWVSQGCIPGLHKEGGACVSDRKACTLNNAAGVQYYNTTTNQWGACQYATDYQGGVQCNVGYHYEGSSCIASTRSCFLSDPYPAQYPRGSSVANGVQTWETWGFPSWGSCNISCKGNNIKRGVYADQVGIGSFFYDGSTSNYLEYCAPVSVELSVVNKKMFNSDTYPRLFVMYFNAKNVDRCDIKVTNSEGVSYSRANVIEGNNEIFINNELKLATVGGTVTATCYSGNTPFTFTKEYQAETQSSYVCSGDRPANSIVYQGDESSVVYAESQYLYSLTNTARKCEYTCASGYTWTGSSCVSTTSGGTGSLTPTVSLTSYPSGTVTQGTSVQFNLSSTNAKSCSVTGSGGSPVYLDKSANTTSKTVYATPGAGVFTAHATCWSDYNGTGNSASDSVSVTAVCPTGTTWNGTSCANNTVTCTGNTYLNNGSCSACPSGTTSDGFTCTPNNTYSCAGSVPINATKVSGSDQGLTSSVPYTHVGTSYGATISPNNKCKFSCNNGYTWDGWECKMNNNGTPSAKLSITVGGVEVTSDVIYPKNITYTLTSTDAKSCEVKDSGGITYLKNTDNTSTLSASGITTPSTLNFTAQCWSDFNGGGIASPVATKSITVKCPMGTTWSSTTTSCY